MNGCLPNWKMDKSRPFHDHPVTNEKKCIGPDNELIELLWRNGHAVLHGQTNGRALPAIFESKQTEKPESLIKCGESIVNLSNFIEEDENASWFQYPLDNSTEKESSEFFYGMPTAEPIRTDKAIKEDNNACAKQPSLHPQENVVPLPSSGTVVGMGDPSSMRTIDSSVCGINQAQNQVEVTHALSNVRGVKDSQMRSTNDPLQENTYEPANASSSGGSGCSFGKTAQKSTTNRSHKRKGRDAEESEVHSEEAEYESAEANKPAHRPASSRRSRASEVHNLSERRRRDKINEKMRALQELIPHCNKSDKASMLDEVIEYLKSLQLQLQIMWMGSGMVPMLFPSIRQYMSRMGIGINHHSMTSIRSPSQLPKVPHDDQSIPAISIPNQPPVFPLQFPSSVNFPTQMHNFHLPGQYSSSLGFPQMQVPPVMNMCTYGPQMMKKNQIVAAVDKQPQACNNK